MLNKMHQFAVSLAALFIMLASGLVCAVEQKGKSNLPYGIMLDKKERQEAEALALQNAIEMWVVEKQRSHFKNYEKVKQDINENIDDYILDYTVIDTKKKNKNYSVLLRAKINEPKLLSALLKPSEQATDGKQAYLSFVFVAREQTGKISRSEKQASQTKSQTQNIGKSRSDNSATQGKSKTNTIGSRRQTTQFNDEAVWEVTTTNEVNVAMGDVFTDANYLVIDAELLEDETGNMLSVAQFITDYQNGNDLSPTTKKDAIKGLQGLKDPVRYFALGTLDIDEQRIDKKSGNYIIAVSITGQVLDIKRRGAAVAKVGPEQMFGEGPTPLVAKNNALKLAAEAVSSKLVAKLSTKNIR